MLQCFANDHQLGWHGGTVVRASDLCDQQIEGSMRSIFGKVIHTCVIWHWPKGSNATMAQKITTGLAESKGSLPPGSLTTL